MVAGFSNNATGGTIVPPTERSQALCTIKSDFLNLMHQADVVVNGKSIEQCQPFINNGSTLSINLRNECQ